MDCPFKKGDEVVFKDADIDYEFAVMTVRGISEETHHIFVQDNDGLVDRVRPDDVVSAGEFKKKQTFKRQLQEILGS